MRLIVRFSFRTANPNRQDEPLLTLFLCHRATFAVSYGLSFASITATLTHAFLFYGKQIKTQARRALHEQPDIHARLMTRYRPVPDWYYACIFVTMFIFAVVCIEVLETDLPVWGASFFRMLSMS